jgi:hypothetical protein
MIGGLIAVGANFLLWPSREPDLLAPEVKKAISANAARRINCNVAGSSGRSVGVVDTQGRESVPKNPA